MDHAFLQFNYRNRKERKCLENLNALWGRRNRIGEPRRLDWEVIDEINQSERLMQMITLPMSRLVNIVQPIYLELIMEFFASYEYDKPKGRSDPAFQTKNRICFRLGGVWHNWTVARFGRELGIYMDDELDTDVFNSMYKFENTRQKVEFWREIAEGPDYEARSSKASRLRDPLLRVMHYIFTHTVCGRMDSTGNCPTPDLLLLYSLHTGEHINLAARVAEFLMNSAGRTGSSQIHGGEYVTQLALSLGILTDATVATLQTVTEGTYVDMRSLRNMDVIVDTPAGPRLRGLQGEIWDPRPPVPAEDSDSSASQRHDEEMPDMAAHDEDVFLNSPLHQFEHGHEHHQEQQQHGSHYHEEHHEEHHQQSPRHDWSGDIPPYPELYRQFQNLQVSQQHHREETQRQHQEVMAAQQRQRDEAHSAYSYIFGGLQSAFPAHFGDPPQFPFGDDYQRGGGFFGGASSSGARRRDDDDDADD